MNRSFLVRGIKRTVIELYSKHRLFATAEVVIDKEVNTDLGKYDIRCCRADVSRFKDNNFEGAAIDIYRDGFRYDRSKALLVQI